MATLGGTMYEDVSPPKAIETPTVVRRPTVPMPLYRVSRTEMLDDLKTIDAAFYHDNDGTRFGTVDLLGMGAQGRVWRVHDRAYKIVRAPTGRAYREAWIGLYVSHRAPQCTIRTRRARVARAARPGSWPISIKDGHDVRPARWVAVCAVWRCGCTRTR